MKFFITIFSILGSIYFLNGQTPQSFNYQAVARTPSGEVMSTTDLGIRMSIVDGISTEVYAESHSLTTNQLGLFSLQVGMGTVISGDIANIDWTGGPYYLKVDIDYSGGTDYIPVGSSQIMSVPYALHAETAAQVDDADADPVNELQMLSIDSNILTISGGNSVNLPVTGGGTGDGDSDPNNEIQDINSQTTGSDVTLTVTKGGTGTTFSIDDGDSDSMNEMQSISKAGNMISLSNGGAVMDATEDADADATNEIQTLSLSGNTLTITKGNSVVLPMNGGGSDADADPLNEIQELSKSGNMISLSRSGGMVVDAVDDADADATNEIQTISKAGNTVTLSNGGGSYEDAVDDADADATNEIQMLSISGSNISITGGNTIAIPTGGTDADADPTNEIQQLALLAIADAGIDGATVYQLDLTDDGIDPINLPYNQWWNAQLLLSLPPQVANINTQYPTIVNNTFEALSVNAPSITSFDVIVGDQTVAATHMNPEGIHWDGGALTSDLGLFLTRDSLIFGETFGAGPGFPDYKMKLNKSALEFVNGGAFKTVQLDGGNAGELRLFPLASGTPYMEASWGGSSNEPQLTFRGLSGNKVIELGYTTQFSADVSTYGPNGNFNARISHLGNFVNNGWMGVYDSGNAIQASMFVNGAGQGVLSADVKNFVMQHPTEESKEIIYASLEGPEAGAYERGTSKMEGGEAEVSFSDHFKHVIGSMKITVMLTPLSADSKGMAVVEKTENGFKVKELHKGKGTYEFDWEVKAVRAGFEDYEVVRSKKDTQPVAAEKKSN